MGPPNFLILDTQLGKRMKIAIYVSSWPPGREASGIVTYTSQLVSSLRSDGHDVYVLTPDPTEKDEYTIDLNDFRERGLSRIWRRGLAKFSSLPPASVEHANKISLAVRMLVEEKGVEVFEIEEAFGWSGQISQRNIVPVVVRLHGPFFLTGRYNDVHTYFPTNRKRAKLEGQAIDAAHYITTSCALVLDAVREHYSLELARSAIIPLPIVAAQESETWSAETCDKNKILFVGRFDSIKGGDLILRAFSELATTNSDLRLTFVGPDGGLKTDGEPLHFEEFVRQNFDESLRSRIDYRGQMKHADLMAMRTSHYLTVIATQYETMGYMLLEAMSLGCPIVSTAVGGIPEVIENERNGLLVPSQNLTAMVAACQRLLDDVGLTTRLGHQAWLDCREFYSPDAVINQTLKAYGDAIELFNASDRS